MLQIAFKINSQAKRIIIQIKNLNQFFAKYLQTLRIKLNYPRNPTICSKIYLLLLAVRFNNIISFCKLNTINKNTMHNSYLINK